LGYLQCSHQIIDDEFYGKEEESFANEVQCFLYQLKQYRQGESALAQRLRDEK
jgi:hypothetical protein